MTGREGISCPSHRGGVGVMLNKIYKIKLILPDEEKNTAFVKMMHNTSPMSLCFSECQ